MKKTVNCCGNCPFCNTEYYYESGDEPISECILSKFLKNDEYFINFNDNVSFYTAEWCPLKNEEYVFNFKEFSDKRKNDILTIDKKITENEYQIDQNIDYDSFEFVSNNIESQELFKKFDELMTSEDISEEDIKEEFNNSIEQIKKQMINLESLGTKLNDEVSKLGNL